MSKKKKSCHGNEPFPAEKIVKEVKNQIIDPMHQKSRKSAKLTNILTSLASLVVLIAALLAADNTMTGIKIKEAEDNIKTDIMWMRQIDHAMLNTRMHEKQAREVHRQGKFVDVDQLNVDRIKYQKGVADAYGGVNIVISDDVHDSASLFNKFDESVPNILASDAPSDVVWQDYLIRNEFLIGIKVIKEEDIIRHEKEFVFKRFFQDVKYLIEKIV